MNLNRLLLVVGSILAATNPAPASPLAFDFRSLLPANSDLGHSISQVIDGITLTAYAFDKNHPGNKSKHLFSKQGGTDENGLGTARGADHEIDTRYFVQLDVSGLETAGYHSAYVTMQSVQSGEFFDIYLSGTLGTVGSTVPAGFTEHSGVDQTSFLLNYDSQNYVSFIAYGSDSSVLLSTFSPTPEPSSFALWGLLGLALSGYGYCRRLRCAISEGG